MCGIAGIIKWTHQNAAVPLATDDPRLLRMSNAIAHRGPDGAGIFVDPRPNTTAALLHRRLAIIDRPGGAQPMPNEDGRVHVVFNGEIYNHAELRQQLTQLGHRFASDHSDTEVLVHGWEQWGVELPRRLLGMFAFAIWDQRPNALGTLFLARDRIGQKPLFYANLEDGLVFGSTIAAVLAWPEVPRRVPKEQIGLYLQLGYLPAPQTIFRDVSALLPGAWLRLRDDVVDGGIYWRPAEARNPKSEIQKTDDQLRQTLQNAIASQSFADVPIACFLSGGIDSSIVAALMQQRIAKAGGDPINTVSVGFAESAFDETAYAALVAKKIGSRHTRLQVDGSHDVIGTLQTLMQTSLGQPFADSSIIPTYHLARAVRQIAPVALAGDGADELFAGYDRYRAMTILERWRSLARIMPRSVPVGSLAKQERYRRLAAAARAKFPSERYTRLIEIFPRQLAQELLREDLLDWLPPSAELGPADNLPALHLAMLRDQQEYLPDDVLCKVDAASMCGIPDAPALEVRAPFLDHRVVELANDLNETDLLRGGVGKAILRRTFAADLPPEILRRAKKGFAVPIGQWFKHQLRDPLHDWLFAPDSFTAAHLHTPTARRIFQEHLAGTRDHTHRLFALLTLEIWWKSADATLDA